LGTKVLVIGLDAAEATLIEKWADEGYLPMFARLRREASVCKLANCLETLPGAIWPELQTGVSCGKRPLFYHPGQIHTGEARPRPITADDVDPEEYYWSVASRAGRRVAVIDQPQTVRFPGLNGIQVFEWGLHDRSFQIAADPPHLMYVIRSRYGDHPVESCDKHHQGTLRGYQQLLQDLIEGVRRKTRLLLDLLASEPWDLFTCVFGETHCVGHQFWHFHDPTHPEHRADSPRQLRDAIKTLYREVDEGVGNLIGQVGSDARVMVVGSHGIGPKIRGYQLLPEVLSRLGVNRGKTVSMHVVRGVPAFVRRAVRKVYRGPMPERLSVGHDARYELTSPTQRAVPVKNNRCGAVRLNLAGREPQGSVQPGSEAADLLALLRRELLALRHPELGEPIVQRVLTAEEAFGAAHHPDVPDLIVVFRTDLGPLDACVSDRIGYLHVATPKSWNMRTGDHTTESRLWAMGPGLPRGTRLSDAHVLDGSPTILRWLGIEPPAWVDGRPIAELDLPLVR
jgi:predicted AlkP superfamily phosphohydrolase/phosphomutase